jgi:hypothetical protein
MSASRGTPQLLAFWKQKIVTSGCPPFLLGKLRFAPKLAGLASRLITYRTSSGNKFRLFGYFIIIIIGRDKPANDDALTDRKD